MKMRLFKNISLPVLLFFVASSVQAQVADCDENCLVGIARQYMEDVVAQDWSTLPWADRVRFTENNVAMMIGDGFWGAVSIARDNAFTLADTQTGNVLWFGITEEHGQAAYYGMRLQVEQGQITEVETYLGREGVPNLFSPIGNYQSHTMFSQELRGEQQRPRERMIALVDGYFNTKQLNDGQLFTAFSDDCVRFTNGVNVTEGEDCRAQMEIGLYRPVDRIRARRYPVVDVGKGVVLALSIEDHATRFVHYETSDGQSHGMKVEYPNSRGMLEMFKIEDGEIIRIEGISVFLPYYIHSLW